MVIAIKKRWKKLLKKLVIYGDQEIAVMAGVNNPDTVQKMVDFAIEKFGAVDIAVSNISLEKRQNFLDISLKDWHEVIKTNLNSAFYLAKAIIPGMKARIWGRIIYISGYYGSIGTLYQAHNVTCKGGLNAFAKAIAT